MGKFKKQYFVVDDYDIQLHDETQILSFMFTENSDVLRLFSNTFQNNEIQVQLRTKKLVKTKIFSEIQNAKKDIGQWGSKPKNHGLNLKFIKNEKFVN